jgi:hypothetical protein
MNLTQSLEPMNVTFVRKRVFADVVKDLKIRPFALSR